MKPEQAIKALESLKNSKGWGYITQVMEREILAAAMQLSDNPNMSEKETDYRRGAMWADKKLLNLPDALIAQNENQILLTSSAKAGEPK
jgi:hypothetical protein